MTVEEILEFIEFANTATYYGPRLYCELDYLDEHIDLSQWTEEDKNRLKERLIECRDNMLEFDRDIMVDVRKKDKIPKERFWWYMDKL